MMNRQRGITGLIVILGLILGFGIWQQRSQAAGPNRQGVQQVASSATGNGLASPALRSATAAPMATITVQSLFFDGPANAANCPGVNCRLRDAIAAAVAGDTIDFSVTGTINLLFGELVIDKNLTINGPGAAQLVISGFNSSRIFRILPGVTVALSGMTVTQGNHNDIGGGIYNSGTLTIVDSIFTYNFSGGRGGAAIFNDGILTVTNNSFSLNRPAPQSSGGAISNFGTATVINSTFFDNLSGPAGGGINNNGTLTIINSTFSRNGASAGGAIYHIGDRILTIINSTISDNSAPQGGGLLVASFPGTQSLPGISLTGARMSLALSPRWATT